nr:universal stress protein [Candidatus Goldiibacteriota bacterium]
SYPYLGPEYWPTLKGFVQGFAIAMISYSGIDTISQMSEEAYDYKKTVPKSYFLLIIVVLIMSVGLPVIAGSVMDPKELATTWSEDPIAGIAYYMPDIALFGLNIDLSAILGPWIAVLAVSILLMATNAGIMGASRLAYSMGQHRQLPSAVFKLHRKYNTPFVAIIFFSLCAAGLLFVGVFFRDIFIKLASLYAYSAMLIFTMAHVSIIALRIKYPDLERPYKTKFNLKIAGKEIPITAVISIFVNMFVWVIIATGDRWTGNIGIIWIVGGFVLYVMYRKKHKLPVHEEVTIERVVEAAYQPVDFYDIIVPTVGDLDAEMIQAACKIAQRDKSRILAIYVIEVPMTLPVDAVIPAEKEKGERALDQAEMIGKEYGVEVDTKLVQARSAGKAIVEEAVKRKADLILLGHPRKTKASDILSGRTINYVAQNAPCRVWVDVAEMRDTEQISGSEAEL